MMHVSKSLYSSYVKHIEIHYFILHGTRAIVKQIVIKKGSGRETLTLVFKSSSCHYQSLALSPSSIIAIATVKAVSRRLSITWLIWSPSIIGLVSSVGCPYTSPSRDPLHQPPRTRQPQSFLLVFSNILLQKLSCFFHIECCPYFNYFGSLYTTLQYTSKLALVNGGQE